MYSKLKEAVEGSDNFYIKEQNINGYDVSIFYYHYSDRDAFKSNPILKFARGTTFIHEDRYKNPIVVPHLPKFFNLNEELSYDELRNEKISTISFKEDGSCIIPVMFPDGSIFCKTIGTFFSEQAEKSNTFIEKNSNYESFIRECYDRGIQPIFEYVSPFNQIVLEYTEESLRLIQFVDKNMDVHHWSKFDFVADYGINKIASWKETDLLEMVERAKTETGLEGWVVQFFHGQMVKIKTNWYNERHRIMSPDQMKPRHIIDMIIKNELDDIVSELSDTKQEYVKEIKSVYMNWIGKAIQDYKELEFRSKDKNRKEVALSNKDHYLFSIYMKNFQENLNEEEILKNLEGVVLRKIKTDSSTKEFLSL